MLIRENGPIAKISEEFLEQCQLRKIPSPHNSKIEFGSGKSIIRIPYLGVDNIYHDKLYDVRLITEDGKVIGCMVKLSTRSANRRKKIRPRFRLSLHRGLPKQKAKSWSLPIVGTGHISIQKAA